MPRNGPAPRRELMPDPVYRSVLVTQVINKVLQRGKRTVAERIVYERARAGRARRPSPTPSRCSSAPSRTSAPSSRCSRRRVGGATYQVPVEVRPRRATTLAIRWLDGLRQGSAARRPWRSASPTRSSTRPTASAPR